MKNGKKDHAMLTYWGTVAFGLLIGQNIIKVSTVSFDLHFHYRYLLLYCCVLWLNF